MPLIFFILSCQYFIIRVYFFKRNKSVIWFESFSFTGIVAIPSLPKFANFDVHHRCLIGLWVSLSFFLFLQPLFLASDFVVLMISFFNLCTSLLSNTVSLCCEFPSCVLRDTVRSFSDFSILFYTFSWIFCNSFPKFNTLNTN